MYAIIESGGKQYKVEEGTRLKVERINACIGQELRIDQILMLVKDKEIITGKSLKDAYVVAEVIHHGRGRKVRIFKFKRRKNYRRRLGHRQAYTSLLIKRIEV